MQYDSKYNTENGRKDYLASNVRPILGTVLWKKAIEYLSAGDRVPEEILDQMLGKPVTVTLTDWKVYAERKMALREYLNKVSLSPSLVKQYIDEYGNKVTAST